MAAAPRSAAASLETAAVVPEAGHALRGLLSARPHTTARFHGCSTDASRFPRPCARSRPVETGPLEPGTSSLHARRSRRCAPAVEHFPEAVQPDSCGATPSWCCDQNDAPTLPAHSRSVVPVPQAASLVPALCRVRPSEEIDPEAEPPARSASRPLPRPCPGQVVPAPGCADSRRSPNNDRLARRQPQRSASADR